MCQHLASTALTNMQVTRTHHIFIAGSFISHPLVQRIVMEEFEAKKWWDAMAMEGIVSENHYLPAVKHFSTTNNCIKYDRS